MVKIHELIIAFFFGIVEGITEFLPISSTGHMILIGSFINFNDNKAKTFEVIIQLGSVLAVIIIFWRRILNILNIRFKIEFNKNIDANCLNLGHILLGILPIMILGLTLYDNIKAIFEPKYVIYALVNGGILLIFGEWLKPKIPHASSLDDITYLQAFLIGCFQCLALWPGFSRLGTTISGGLLIGVSRCAASEFSFIMAIPIMLGATILDLYKNLPFLCFQDILIFVIGFVSSFVSALVVMTSLIRVIKDVTCIPFAIYRFILAAIVYWILIDKGRI